MPTAVARPRAATVRSRATTQEALAASVAKGRAETRLADAARHLEDKRRLREAALVAFDEAERAYIEAALHAKEVGVKTKVLFTATNGMPMTATFVDGTGKKTQIDVAKLQNKLGAARWKRVTVPTLDKKLLDQAIDKGVVAAAEVAACMTIEDKKSYASFTVRTKDIVAAVATPVTARRVRKPVR